MAKPIVTTQSSTNIALTSATGNGNIISGASITERGFEYNTVQAQAPDDILIVKESGSHSTGAFTGSLVGLTPGQKYYIRAYAKNADGYGYGGWAEFTCTSPTYNVTINGIDRTGDILNKTLKIIDAINEKVNTCQFILDDLSGNGIPNNDQEITITLDDGTVIFGGYILNVSYMNKMRGGAVRVSVACVDYVRLLDRNLVHRTYTDKTDLEIVNDIITRYCAGVGITTTNVIEGATIDQKSFNYLQPSEAINQICELTGRHWFIDYNKDIHYFPLTTVSAPFDIDVDSANYSGINISRNASQIKNRVYVRGGTKLSDFTTYIEKGNGEKLQFVLPDKPHSVTMEVDRGAGYIEETVGIKNVDTTGSKWYLNFQEKYIEQDDSEVVLGATDKMRLTYKYDIPILVAVENTASIAENGQREFVIFDKSITTTQSARDRATGELTDYANDVIEGSFLTWETGFVSGQYMNINLPEYEVDDDYVVQKVVAKANGAGHYQYEVYIASVKTLGIIKFLIKLLEANKNLIELDDDEVVDELLQLSDSLLSDSLIDSLVIDSTGPYHVYQVDSTPYIEDLGIARWGLSQYKY